MKKLLLSASILITLVSCGKQKDLDRLNDRVDDTNNRVATLENSLQGLYTLIDNNAGDISTLEALVHANQIQLTQINQQENVTDIIDPCGNNPGHFDEIILVTSTGKFIAYFEVGNNRFLSVLEDGSYQTTDAQACRFEIQKGDYLEL